MGKIIAFDLDDVICVRPPDVEHLGLEKYNHCVPIQKNVDLVNECYDAGYTIIVYTARGGLTIGRVEKIEEILRPLTERQLEEWGVKYHQLVMGKLHYDILIDDKAVNSLDVGSLDDIQSQMKRWSMT